jgi:triosephosphate isomerase
LGETDAFVNRKVLAALSAGLEVIFCIGETLEQRQTGLTDQVLATQAVAGLAGVTTEQMSRLTIAYEPVWAIGKNDSAMPSEAQAAHAHVRELLATRFDIATAQAVTIQYGGSVKPKNAGPLLLQPDVDGALVGGASLKADDFLGIVRAAP